MADPNAPRHAIADFEAAYAGTPPWDIGRPQPAFAALADAGAFNGRVLDVGCGTGEHALLAAAHGLDATGIDAAPTAIAIAKRKAADRGLTVRFMVWDALDLASLGEQFDTILDMGLFHVFDDVDREQYVAGLRAVAAPGARLFLMCFSDRVPGESGPRRVSEAELRLSFAGGWRIDGIDRARLETNMGAEPIDGWLASFTRA